MIHTATNEMEQLTTTRICKESSMRIIRRIGFHDFGEKLKSENDAVTGLPNLDSVLNNGWSSGLHVIAGTTNIGKRSLLNFLTEEFAKQKFAVVMISSKETNASFIQRIIARTTFKNDPSKAIPFHQVSNHLSSNSLISKQLLNQIVPSVKYMSLIETLSLDFYSLEDRIRLQKQTYSQSIIMLDLHEF